MNSRNMLRPVLVAAVLFLGCHGAWADGYLDNVFQGNVCLGESLTKFRAAHGKVILMKTVSEKEGSFDFGEMPSRTDLRMYYFRKGRLAGYMKFFRTTQLDAKQRQAASRVADPEKSGEFTKIGISQAARSTRDLQMETIQVVNWKSKTTPDLELYTVDAPSEITVIAFEPSRLSWKDFFVGPEIKDKLEASRQHIEKVLSDAKAQKRSPSTPGAQVSSSPLAATATPTTDVKKPASSNFPIMPMVIGAALIAGVAVFFLRRKQP